MQTALHTPPRQNIRARGHGGSSRGASVARAAGKTTGQEQTASHEADQDFGLDREAQRDEGVLRGPCP